MPPAERLALKRHERRLKELKEAAANKSTESAARKHHRDQEADTGDRQIPHRRHQDQTADITINRRHRHNADQAAEADLLRRHHHPSDDEQTAHDRRLAEKAWRQHEARLAAHNARLAKLQAQERTRLQARAKRVAEVALQRSANAATRNALHSAQLATQHSHDAAMHGDESGGKSITYWQTVEASVSVKVITVDLNDRNVKVSAVMSRSGDGTSEPFHNMIERCSPNVAVTGTFFSLDNLKPIGDIVVGGSLVHFGGMGTALCVTPENRADMITVPWGHHHDWRAYDFVCACGPRLLHGHQIVLDPHAERFKDQHMLSPNSRIAVGILPSNKIVFVMTRQPIYLGRLAKVMAALGCSEAMNLDAGTSTGFYYNGTTLARPGRKLTNMIVVFGHRSDYERVLDQLVTPAYRQREAVVGRAPGRRVAQATPKPESPSDAGTPRLTSMKSTEQP